MRDAKRLVPMTHADVSWLWEGAPFDGERRKALERLSSAFDAAPEPVKRRRCVTHDAEYSCETARGEPLCWMSSERGHANPCRFVSVFEVPASPSDATSETTP